MNTDLASFILHESTGLSHTQLATSINEQFIVINKNELPPVTVDNHGNLKADGTLFKMTEGQPEPRRVALATLAVVAHLEMHPPIDEEQVNKIRRAINHSGADTHVTQKDAIDLYRSGIRVP